MLTVTQKGRIELSFKIEEAIEELDGASSRMVERAKTKVPVDTGNLKRSIQKTSSGTSFEVYAGAEYAIYQEEGFRHWKSGKKIPGKKFMEGAFQATSAELDAGTSSLKDKCIEIKGNQTIQYR